MLEGSEKSALSVFEEVLELAIKLFMHSLDVGDTHGEVIGVANGLYGKLSDQIELCVVQIVHHLGYRHVLLFCRYEEVDFTEMVTIHNVNIYNILFEWQDKG